MAEKFGIENLEKVFKFGLTLGGTVVDDIKDNKMSMTEIFALIPQLTQIPDLLSHKQDIINEAGDLSMDEITKLTKDIEGVFTNAKVVAVIEKSIVAIVAIKDLISSVKDLLDKTPVSTTNADGTAK